MSVSEYLAAHSWLSALIRAALILAAAWAAALLCRRVWQRDPRNSQSLFRKFAFNIIRVLIYLAGVLGAIGQAPQLSRVVQTILAGSGIVALAVSLSAQESLNNVVSGMFITICKPFEVGDRVTIVSDGITGSIEDITLRHTVIRTFTNTRVIVPNAKMNQEIVENSNIVDAHASAFIDVTVTYGSDIDKAMDIMARVIGSHPLYWDPRPEEARETAPRVRVYVRELGACGVQLRANMWTRTVDENFDACSDVRLQIKKAFDAEGIEIPSVRYAALPQEA